MLSLKERDNADAKQRELQRELDNLNERMEASQRAWTATKRELAQYEGRYTHLDREVHNKSIVAQNAESQYRNFKELLARMLCDGACVVEPYEEQIREQVQRLLTAVHDRSSVGVTAQITTNQSPSRVSESHNYRIVVMSIQCLSHITPTFQRLDCTVLIQGSVYHQYIGNSRWCLQNNGSIARKSKAIVQTIHQVKCPIPV